MPKTMSNKSRKAADKATTSEPVNPVTSSYRPSRKVIQRSSIIVLLFVIGLVVFTEVIRPNQNASHYTSQLDQASTPLEQCFDKLAATTQLKIYYAPDIPLATKQADTTSIRQQITTCRQELNRFNKTAATLPGLQWAGYTRNYREAQVNQRQAFDIAGQSNDVMNQYDTLAAFLHSYYEHIGVFLGYSQQLSNLNTAVITTANTTNLRNQATDLRQRAKTIQDSQAPAEFDSTKQATADMFNATANGLETLARGYSQGADYITAQGFEQVDQAVKDYDSTVVNLPFQHLSASYIPKQVQQLPNKVADLLASQAE